MKRTKRPTPKPKAKQPSKASLGMSLEELRELEEKAVRLEKLARLLLKTPQQAFYLYDYSKQEFVLGQEHVSGLYGYKAGEIEKRKGGWFSIIHPDDLAEFREAHRLVMESGSDEVRTMRVRVLRKKGGHEWILAHMRPFERDAKGSVISEAGMAIITTPLVETERALRETEARCHSLFQSNAAGVLVFDAKFHIVDANPAACRMLGYDKKALLRLSVLDLTLAGNRTEMHRLLRTMKNGTKPSQSLDSVLERQNGEKVHVMAAPACLRDEKGGFQQGMLILLDITERQRELEEMKREADLNKVLVDHAPVCIGLLAPDGTVLRVNTATEKLFGYKQKEVQGSKVWDHPVLSPGEVEASKRRIEALASGAGRMSLTLAMNTRSGEKRHVATEHTAVKKPEGGVDFIITTGVDITEQRKLEAEVIRVAEQEHIRIGHDLHDGVGQTLTGICSLVEALMERLSGEEHKDARRIHELVKTATAETRRLSHGLSPAAVKNRGLAGGLMLIAETVRENFRRECVCHIEDPVPVVGQEAEIHLFRIAQEAVNNAIRHGGAGKIHLSLRRKSPTEGLLEIRDNGRGFPGGKVPEQSEGIGLRVMEHRAHLISGDLKILTHKGRGVRLICQFPLKHS